jgi:transposase
VSARLAGRARIVLLAAEGLSNAEIARRTGTSRPTVLDWRARYDAGGIRALDDLPRSGRPPEMAALSELWHSYSPLLLGSEPRGASQVGPLP